jgi:hypothetical protein
MTPGAPATCSAAVRAIWLARPATRVSKVSAGVQPVRAWPPAPAERGAAMASRGRWRWVGASAAPSSAAAGNGGGRGRCRAQGIAGAGRRFGARGQRQFQPHRVAGQVGEHRLDAPGVLRTDPVELEAVGHAAPPPRRACSRFVTGPCSGGGMGASGRIQVLNCCSGSSAARRSQPRCHRSEAHCGHLLLGAAEKRGPSAYRRTAVIHTFERRRQAPPTRPNVVQVFDLD